MKSPTSSVGRIDEDGILNGSARNDRSRNTISKTGKNAFEYSTHDGSRNAADSTCSRCAIAVDDSDAGTAARWRSKLAIATRARSRRRLSSTSLSTSQAAPVTAVKRNRIRAKFIGNGNVVHIGWDQTGSRKRADCRTPGGSLLRRGRPATMAALVGGSLLANLEDCQESLLRNFDAADRLHSFLARFLFLEQLFLARHIAAVAFCQHVFTESLDRFARDDLRADRRLDRDVEHLPRNQRTHLRCDFASPMDRNRAMHHHRQRVDTLAVDQNIELDDIRRAKLPEFVIE